MCIIIKCSTLLGFVSIFSTDKNVFDRKKNSTGYCNLRECYQYLSLNNFSKMKIVLAKGASDR